MGLDFARNDERDVKSFKKILDHSRKYLICYPNGAGTYHKFGVAIVNFKRMKDKNIILHF